MNGPAAAPASGLRRLLLAGQRFFRPETRIARAYRPAPARAFPTTGALVSLVLPVHNTPFGLLAACVASVLQQTYQDWQLCIADDASDPPLRLTAADGRIRTVRLRGNAGIAAASNAALGLATGSLVGFLDHDDLLAPDALAAMADAAARAPEAGLLFSDEDQIVAGVQANPYFKPGWNPELLRGQNVVGHLAVYRRLLLDRVGGLRSGFEGSQDWELALRASRQTQVCHVPVVAYHWRQRAASFSASRSEEARQSGLRAVQAHLPDCATAVPAPGLPQWVRVVYPMPARPVPVSLVLPAGAASPGGAGDIDIERVATPAEARGAVLVLLAPDLHAASPGWLRELVSQALRPDIGAVGGRLDRPDGRIAQSGLLLHPRLIAQTLRPRSDADDPGYRGHFALARTVSAVHADCLAVRRDAFAAAGGLDPRCGRYADVDLCLRMAQAGLPSVWTPHARLRYAALPRERADPGAAALMRARWGAALAAEPYLNPHLTVRGGGLALRRQ